MPKEFTQAVVQNLWQAWYKSSPDMQSLENALKHKGISTFTQDHFAIIDLPSAHSGIPHLKQIFETLGYAERGKDYLADKQNDFLWMGEANCENLPPREALPQVVVADFRLDEMPSEIASIIHHYGSQTAQSHPDITSLQSLSKYFGGRDWPAPTVNEFHKVREFNELLAWVLVFGRRPNHFTLSIHLLDEFSSLEAFHQFVEQDAKLSLNQEGGTIKGGKEKGIAQGSTSGITQKVDLADGQIEIPLGFVEFVWRYPLKEGQTAKWGDYFPDFVGSQANRVIESLYTDKK